MKVFKEIFFISEKRATPEEMLGGFSRQPLLITDFHLTLNSLGFFDIKQPFQDNPPRQLPHGQLPPGQLSPDNSHLGQLPPGQFPPRTISPCTIPPDISHLGLLYCPRIIIPGQLLPRAMANYNFFMSNFCFFSMAQLYNFCYDNKNNNENSNKTWSLKVEGYYPVTLTKRSQICKTKQFLKKIP